MITFEPDPHSLRSSRVGCTGGRHSGSDRLGGSRFGLSCRLAIRAGSKLGEWSHATQNPVQLMPVDSPQDTGPAAKLVQAPTVSPVALFTEASRDAGLLDVSIEPLGGPTTSGERPRGPPFAMRRRRCGAYCGAKWFGPCGHFRPAAGREWAGSSNNHRLGDDKRSAERSACVSHPSSSRRLALESSSWQPARAAFNGLPSRRAARGAYFRLRRPYRRLAARCRSWACGPPLPPRLLVAA